MKTYMDALNEGDATPEIANEAEFHTPEKTQKIPKFYIWKGREWMLSPSSKRLGKTPKMIDEVVYNKVYKLVRTEMHIMWGEIMQEVHTQAKIMYEQIKKQMETEVCKA